MKKKILLLLFLLSITSVLAEPYINDHHDHIYVYDEDNAILVQYDTNINEIKRVNTTSTYSIQSYTPDGGVLLLTPSGEDTLRYTPQLNESIYTFGQNALSTSGSYHAFTNRIQKYFAPRGSGYIYSYNNIDDDSLNQAHEYLTEYDDTVGFGVSNMNRASGYYYNRLTKDYTFMHAKSSTSSGFGLMTDQLDRLCYKTISSTNTYSAMETLPSLSVITPDRIYVGTQTQFSAYDREGWETCSGNIDVLPTPLWTRTLPTNMNLKGEGLFVWTANNNRIVAYGEETSGINDVSIFQIYSRDNSLIAGYTTDRGSDSQYVHAVEAPNGDLLLLEMIDSQNANIVQIPISGSVTTHDLGFEITQNSRIAYDNVLTHYRQGNQLGMLPFTAIPKDVYEYDLNPTYNDTESYLTYDYIDIPTRTVHVTVSDVVLDNLPIQILASHPSSENIEFSSIALNKDLLTQYNTTLQNTISNTTIPNPLANNTKDDYTMFELEFDIILNRLSSQDSIFMLLDFISANASDLAGWDHDVSDRISIQRYYTTPDDSLHSGIVRTYYGQIDDDSIDNQTLLTTESEIDGSITSMKLTVMIDVSQTPHKMQVRSETTRDSGQVSVEGSVWVPILAFLPAEEDGFIQDIIMRLTESNVQGQVAFKAYGYNKLPSFSSGVADVGTSRMQIARILSDGTSTIRTYYTTSVTASDDHATIHYIDWNYDVTLDNAVILGVDGESFEPSDPYEPIDPSGGDWLRSFGGFSLAQSTFIYTVGVILLTWLIIVGYSIYVSNLTGSAWVTSVGVVLASLTSILWVFVAVFIGWLPVWVVVLMILLGAGIATMIFRNTFMGG